jgi:hypothetical protein
MKINCEKGTGICKEIKKEDKKWKNELKSKNNKWQNKENEISIMTKKKIGKLQSVQSSQESGYFLDLLRKETDKQNKPAILKSTSKSTEEIIRKKEQRKINDKNKEKKIDIEELRPIFGGYKKGILKNDNKNIFKYIIKERNKLVESKVKGEQIIETQEVSKNLFKIKKKINKLKKLEYRSIISEKCKNIILRKTTNKLKSINYYFTPRYVSRSMTTQLRSWPNTIYSYIKGTIRNIKYKDMMVSKVINIFMNPIYLKRRIVQGERGEKKGIWGISIKGIKILSKYINEMIKYTSLRSRQEIKKVENYNNIILTLPWIKKEIGWARSLRKYLKERRSGIISGYMPKRRVNFNKERKMYISKPLFKHTAWNVVIDLFVYNNKSYKLGKYHNMLKLRALYKYMYSMYINYREIVQNIMLRPRIFYINIIEPKINNYYYNVIGNYEKIIIHMSKKEYIYLILNILKWNYSNKIYSKINKLIKNLTWNYDKRKQINTETQNKNNITRYGKIQNKNMDKIKDRYSEINEINEREISQKNSLSTVIENDKKRKRKKGSSFGKWLYKKSEIIDKKEKKKIIKRKKIYL